MFFILAHEHKNSHMLLDSTRSPCSTFVESVKITNCNCMKWFHTPAMNSWMLLKRTHMFVMFYIQTRKLAVSLNDITTRLGTSTLYFALFSHDYPLSAASAQFYIFFREMKPQFNGNWSWSCIDNFIQRQIIECERLRVVKVFFHSLSIFHVSISTSYSLRPIHFGN